MVGLNLGYGELGLGHGGLNLGYGGLNLTELSWPGRDGTIFGLPGCTGNETSSACSL